MRKFIALALLIFVTLLLNSVGSDAAESPTPTLKSAIFAGGCFWCMQPPFDHAKGVVKTIVGYTGGSKEDATYELVSGHKTKHREAIEVTYDPASDAIFPVGTTTVTSSTRAGPEAGRQYRGLRSRNTCWSRLISTTR